HSGRKKVIPGEFIQARIDLALGNDITAPLAIEEFNRTKSGKVFNSGKIALVPDHFTPSKDVKSAAQVKILKDFARKQKIKYFFKVGEMGIEHALLPEQGLVSPGDLIIGADSHTCTYGALGAFASGVGSTDLAYAFITGRIWLRVPPSIKFVYKGKLKRWAGGKDIILYTIGKIGVNGAHYAAMEFSGEVIEKIGIDGRFTICNMAIEAGAKSGIIAPDRLTKRYLSGVPQKRGKKRKIYQSDKKAGYKKRFEFAAGDIDLQVAFPSLPSNTRPINKVGRVSIDQVVIGSCTNGRISDLRVAAKILAGKKVKSTVRTIIIPATQKIYLEALKEGLIEVFLKSGAVVSTPSCGPCLGGHLGVLAQGEKALSTTNRNFVGRMGDLRSKVFLSGPAVAAASALAGRITGPDDL
ncbi:MAG: 3-isopropylmalate dehydratase large subunit, partial [Candidatus Ratteibacteria bacterium]|nr:3-isopropylmalate dehydratase large subunit [Candidatus Ratteibacteria bacterium]